MAIDRRLRVLLETMRGDDRSAKLRALHRVNSALAREAALVEELGLTTHDGALSDDYNVDDGGTEGQDQDSS